MPIYAIDEVSPRFAEPGSVFVAPDATLIGRVEIGRRVGIWFGAVRCAATRSRSSSATTATSRSMSSCTPTPAFRRRVGTGCTIGHKAILHGCTIGDTSPVGMGAVVLNGARVGSRCLVGAGALLTPGKSFADGMLIVGAPARAVRPLSAEELASLAASAAHYVANAARFRAGLEPISA